MKEADEIRQRLIGTGGRMSQDLGLGRITGQILVFLYLSRTERSLDEIGAELGLSKASVSIAVRQLERLGMIIRVWKPGDRKSYYRTADNFTAALQKGMVEFVNMKMQVVGTELDHARRLLDESDAKKDRDLQFLEKRVGRAVQLKDRVFKLIDNPLMKMLQK